MGNLRIVLLALLLTLSLACSAMALGNGIVIVKVGHGTYASGVAIQNDGKILISASSFFADQGRSILIRRNADGSTDQSFGHDGMVTTGFPDHYIESEGMALQPDGKAVLAGRIVPMNRKDKSSGRTNDDVVVVRYTPD